MKLSIIIPAHNEQAAILQVLEKTAGVDIGLWKKEIIVVDDGSSDKTPELLKSFGRDFRGPENRPDIDLRIFYHKINSGKGAAVKSGLERVTGDYVIIQDADLEYDPGDIPKLLSLIPNLSGEKDYQTVVFGDRGTKRYPERGFHYVVGAKLLTWAVNLLYGARLADLYTGYKLIPSLLMKSLDLKAAGFEFEAEVTCKLFKKGVKIKEVSINYSPRSKAQGKHIGFSDALRGFWTILENRF